MDLLEMRRKHCDEMLAAARGDIPVDTLVHGGRILNVLTGDILDGDIAIHQIFFVEIGEPHRLAGVGLVDDDRLEGRHASTLPSWPGLSRPSTSLSL